MKIVRLLCISIVSLPLLLQADEGRTEISQADLPLTIATPGSYILTQNLNGGGLVDAINITSWDVTLDLNGFQMIGTGGTGDAISVGAVGNVTVRNGMIRGWAGKGIDAPSATRMVCEDLVVSNNGGSGIEVGDYCRISDVTVDSNANNGIQTGDGGLVRHCVASENGTDGTGSGIVVNESCIVLECLTFDNSTYEIQVGARNRIERNLCDCNGPGPLLEDTGIQIIDDDNLVRDNHVTGCLTAYNTGSFADNNIVVANTAANNNTDFDVSSGGMAGEITSDINSTNNINAGHSYMNVYQD